MKALRNVFADALPKMFRKCWSKTFGRRSRCIQVYELQDLVNQRSSRQAIIDPGSSKGRTPDSGSGNPRSTRGPGTNGSALAQPVEHRTVNADVSRSNREGGAI